MELYRQSGSKFWTADFIVNGRRYRKSTKQTIKSRAGEVAADFLRQAQREELPTRKGPVPTLREFAEMTFLPLNDANSKTEESTKEYYRYGWQLLQGQAVVGMKMDAIRTPHIETIHVAGSPSTHNCALRTLRRMFHIASELDVIMKIPKISLSEENERTALITSDIERRMDEQLGKSSRKGSLRTALFLIVDCGLRPKEIVSLRITDVDLTSGAIRVQVSKTKAGKRLVPITDRAKELLFKQIGKRTDGWLFPSPRYTGKHIQRHALTQAWRVTANKAGVSPDVELYCGRHTFATDVMKATKDPFLTMKLLGHTELSTTERYQHPDMGMIGVLMDERNALRHNPRHSRDLVK